MAWLQLPGGLSSGKVGRCDGGFPAGNIAPSVGRVDFAHSGKGAIQLRLAYRMEIMKHE